jgi:hypothetical protein
MTEHGLAGELPPRERARAMDGAADGARAPAQDGGEPGERRRPSRVSLAEILSLCDRHLDEVGRRNHLFGWLRPPGAGADEWLAVDAYYPRNRLVVVYRPRRRAHEQVYRELVPKHGLRLLEVSPTDFGSTSAGAERAVAAILAELPPPAAPPGQTEGAERGARRSRGPAEQPDLWSRVSTRAAAAVQGATARPRPAAGTARTRPAPRREDATSEPRRPSAAERASRFLTTRAKSGSRRAPAPASAESPLPGVALALVLALVLVVAVIYFASTGGG